MDVDSENGVEGGAPERRYGVLRQEGDDGVDASGKEASYENALASLEMELAFLRCLPFARPIGKHRHFRVIALQKLIQDMTGATVTFTEIWDRLDGMYDLEELDGMASTSSSLPASPRSLSPLPFTRPQHDYISPDASPRLSPSLARDESEAGPSTPQKFSSRRKNAETGGRRGSADEETQSGAAGRQRKKRKVETETEDEKSLGGGASNEAGSEADDGGNSSSESLSPPPPTPRRPSFDTKSKAQPSATNRSGKAVATEEAPLNARSSRMRANSAASVASADTSVKSTARGSGRQSSSKAKRGQSQTPAIPDPATASTGDHERTPECDFVRTLRIPFPDYSSERNPSVKPRKVAENEEKSERAEKKEKRERARKGNKDKDKESASANCINSRHFRSEFVLPLLEGLSTANVAEGAPETAVKESKNLGGDEQHWSSLVERRGQRWQSPISQQEAKSVLQTSGPESMQGGIGLMEHDQPKHLLHAVEVAVHQTSPIAEVEEDQKPNIPVETANRRNSGMDIDQKVLDPESAAVTAAKVSESSIPKNADSVAIEIVDVDGGVYNHGPSSGFSEDFPPATAPQVHPASDIRSTDRSGMPYGDYQMGSSAPYAPRSDEARASQASYRQGGYSPRDREDLPLPGRYSQPQRDYGPWNDSSNQGRYPPQVQNPAQYGYAGPGPSQPPSHQPRQSHRQRLSSLVHPPEQQPHGSSSIAGLLNPRSPSPPLRYASRPSTPGNVYDPELDSSPTTSYDGATRHGGTFQAIAPLQTSGMYSNLVSGLTGFPSTQSYQTGYTQAPLTHHQYQGVPGPRNVSTGSIDRRRTARILGSMADEDEIVGKLDPGESDDESILPARRRTIDSRRNPDSDDYAHFSPHQDRSEYSARPESPNGHVMSPKKVRRTLAISDESEDTSSHTESRFNRRGSTEQAGHRPVPVVQTQESRRKANRTAVADSTDSDDQPAPRKSRLLAVNEEREPRRRAPTSRAGSNTGSRSTNPSPEKYSRSPLMMPISPPRAHEGSDDELALKPPSRNRRPSANDSQSQSGPDRRQSKETERENEDKAPFQTPSRNQGTVTSGTASKTKPNRGTVRSREESSERETTTKKAKSSRSTAPQTADRATRSHLTESTQTPTTRRSSQKDAQTTTRASGRLGDKPTPKRRK